jgi:hypothetical protein
VAWLEDEEETASRPGTGRSAASGADWRSVAATIHHLWASTAEAVPTSGVGPQTGYFTGGAGVCQESEGPPVATGSPSAIDPAHPRKDGNCCANTTG